MLTYLYQKVNLFVEPPKVFFVCVDEHAPSRTKRVRSCKSPWITPYLKKRMHERDILKFKASWSKDAKDWRIFKTLQNKVNNEIKQSKESYYKNALNTNKGNSRETWRIINELRSKRHKCTSVKEIILNGTSIINSDELSDVFNDHFSNMGPRLASKIPNNVSSPSYLHYLSHTKRQFVLDTTTDPKVYALL